MEGTCLLKLGPSTLAGRAHGDPSLRPHWCSARQGGQGTSKLPRPQWRESGNQAALRNAPEQGQTGPVPTTRFPPLIPLCVSHDGCQKDKEDLLQGHSDIFRTQRPAGPWEVAAPHSLVPFLVPECPGPGQVGEHSHQSCTPPVHAKDGPEEMA